ncbi:MAG: family 10 glycosylhydrolase, partial [Planctomycetaceae bacterium]
MLARWIALGILLFAAELSTRACTAAEAPRAVRFRVEWGGGPARLWSGLIEGGNARLENPSSLGVEADEPGTIWSEGKNLWMRRRSIGVYDGFDVTAIGDPDSKITFTLQSEDPNDHGELEPQRHQIEFRLSEISAEPRVYSLTGETRLALRRTPGDNLRIQIDRPHLVFAPGETFVGQINGNLANESRNASGTLTWELRRARTNSILRDGTRNISTIDRDAKPESVSIPLPEAEGVYDIRFTLAGRGHGDEKTTIQVVVLSDKPLRRTSGATDGKLVDSFVPSRAGLFRRVEHRSGVRSVNNSLGRVFRFATPAATDSAEAQNSSRVHWQAYRLQVKNPETPHRLVVTLPANRRQSVGISVMEPNAAGQLMPPCLDSGIAVRGNNDVDGRSSADGQSVTHEILFWPRVKEPIVLLHDLGVGRQFEVSKVELIEQAGFNLATESIPAPNPTRLIGPYLSKPYFPENFGATEAFDAQSRRSLDDWESFRTGSERLMQYLKHEGFNSLLLAAFADGSTIYPSRVLEPTPRYDTGVYFSTGQDPVRKDVLELLYRMFDREGLVLIPELQFHSPLPTLEKLIARGHEEDRGIELIGSNGRSYREIRGASRGLAPYYNPLHPRVQEAILDVVQEVVTRYRHHSAFQGIAVQLGNSSYVQFPGLEWGYDDETIARFERGTGIQVPTTPGRDRFEERYGFLTGPERNRWIQWRCNEIAQFHRRLADVVASAGPNTKLIFSGTPATSNNPSE